MKNLKIAIVGGGASGMMVAGKLASFGFNVTIFEKNEKLGKKLFITGKGRCNLTNYCNENEFLNNVVNNSKFLYSTIYNYNTQYIVELFNNLGLKTKIERGNRVFPLSDKSSDVLKVLNSYCINNNVKINLNEKVLNVNKKNNLFIINTIKGSYTYDIVILSTGGKTYQATGSTGDGYNFAKCFGHTITNIYPGLVPIKLKDSFISNLEGLSLKNVSLFSLENERIFKSIFGELLFTNNGISGPIALSMSSYINKKNINDIKLYIDFKPALSIDKLIDRLNRDIINLFNKQISTLLSGLLPKKLVPIFLQKCNFSNDLKCKSLIDKDILVIANLLKKFDLKYNGLYDLNFGIITSGGVSTKEINPKTMESKLVKNLFFTGEIIDVDALTGGFNLQIAWSTANSVANYILNSYEE